MTEFETVIGLEIHVELKTKTKIFCSCGTDFGAEPNTLCCPVCMGMPGTLPVLNEKAVDLAVTAGLALGISIREISYFDRKHYFYPDLPKAYQISQNTDPVCIGGHVDIAADGGSKRIGITRIHMEEDAGKLLHSEGKTFIDHNRCSVPLIEIVTEPDMRSAEEARIFTEKLRSILVFTGVSDCKMNEGSLRCDVNLSVRPRGVNRFGERTEIKNINSFAFISKAISAESERQINLIKSGGVVVRETRRFDEASGKTFPMRKKESSSDYRFLRDPDLPPLVISKERLCRLRSELPRLPDDYADFFMNDCGMSATDCCRICSSPELAKLFDASSKLTKHHKTLANIMLSAPAGKENIAPKRFAELAELTGSGVISAVTAKKLTAELISSDFDVKKEVRERGLAQITSREELEQFAALAIENCRASVDDFLKGKDSAFKSIMGKAMSYSGGKASPALLSDIVSSKLSSLRDKNKNGNP